MKARDPDGGTWRVDRRWLPWQRRIRNPYASQLDALTGVGGSDPVSVALSVIGLVLAIPAIVLGLLVAFEFLALLLLFPLVLAGRVLLGRHWIVTVRRERDLWTESDGGDWQSSGLLIHDVARRIEAGDHPARTTATPAEKRPA